jgi:hypothetical protein
LGAAKKVTIMNNSPSTFNIITLAIALVGAILGIINTLLSINRHRVKIKVTPKVAYLVGQIVKTKCLAIEILNLSDFPVTISQVGILYRGTKDRGDIVLPNMPDGGSFPRRLESRASFTVYSNPEVILENNFANVYCAYAETDCKVLAKGRSPALKELVKKVRKRLKPT